MKKVIVELLVIAILSLNIYPIIVNATLAAPPDTWLARGIGLIGKFVYG